MKTSIKLPLIIIIALALLACLVVLVTRKSQPDDLAESFATSIPYEFQVPTFELHVVPPRSGLPLGGILPDTLVRRFDGTPSELVLDLRSPGAKIVSLENNHLELTADGGWTLFLESDSAGRIGRGTHLVFPLGLGGNPVKLDCRPADPAVGQFQTIARQRLDELSGRFVVELATCVNAESGKTTNWPPAPLKVHGGFNRLPRGAR